MEIWELRLHTVTYELSPGYTEKNNNMHKFTLLQFIAIFMPIFLRFNKYIEFLKQSLKIVRNMQNSVETCGNFIYAPSLGCLYSNPYLHEETK